MSEEEFAPAICPFCGRAFESPLPATRNDSSCGCGAVFEEDVIDSTMVFEDEGADYLNTRNDSSCGCGAVFEIVSSEDVIDSTMVFEDEGMEVRTIPNFDRLGQDEADPNPEWATAVFAKKKE